MTAPAAAAGCMQQVWHPKGNIVHVQKRLFYIGSLNLVIYKESGTSLKLSLPFSF